MSDVAKKTAGGKSLDKPITLGTALFLIVEAVVGFFVVLKPVFIDSVYHNSYLDENGYQYSVSFFGNLFASEAEKGSGTIMLSLSGAVLNLVLIYLIVTVLPLMFVLLFKKGYAFAKTGFTAVFGAKTIIGLIPLLVPFANVRNSMRIFGAADAVLCLGMCALYVYLSNMEYADDMLFDGDQIKAMVKRAKFGGIMLLMMAALVVLERFAMPGYGINWSIIIGKSDQQLMQGYVLVALLSLALVCTILYIRGSDVPMYFFAGFGGAVALTNAFALIQKVIWVNTTYKEQKALKNQGDAAAAEWIGANGMGPSWWRRVIFIALCFVIGAVTAFLAFTKVKRRLLAKPAEDEKKPALITMICSAALIVCFFLTVITVLQWDKKIYDTFVMGAMDYMYLIAYGGITLFLALALMGGCGFAKWGALALYIVVGASNFTTIFKVFNTRNSLAAAYPGYHGYDYIIIGAMFILSLLCCFTVIALFVYKEISNYMYNKSNAQLS